MKYEFDHKLCHETIVFALTLNKKNFTERILVGNERAIRARLTKNQDANVLCDITRPLGSLLINFEQDLDGGWGEHGLMPLFDSIRKNKNRFALEQEAREFLSQKFNSNDPVKMYVSFRIWNEYLRVINTRRPKEHLDSYEDLTLRFIYLFRSKSLSNLCDIGVNTYRKQQSYRFRGNLPLAETKLTLWYPNEDDKSEYAIIYETFYPLILYYLQRLQNWGLKFCQCKNCQSIFLAPSQHHELCSEACRKNQATQNKRKFDDRAKANKYDRLYINERQHWQNQINSTRNNPDFPNDQLEIILQEFKNFKSQALKMKKEVKNGNCSIQEFETWINDQNNLIFELTHPSTPKQ